MLVGRSGHNLDAYKHFFFFFFFFYKLLFELRNNLKNIILANHNHREQRPESFRNSS